MARQLMGGGGGEESTAKTASPPRYGAPRRCVRFWDGVERNGSIPFLEPILVFGLSTERN
jgi:hypothetical protein